MGTSTLTCGNATKPLLRVPLFWDVRKLFLERPRDDLGTAPLQEMAFACMFIDGVTPTHQESDRRTRRHRNSQGSQMTFEVDRAVSGKRPCRSAHSRKAVCEVPPQPSRFHVPILMGASCHARGVGTPETPQQDDGADRHIGAIGGMSALSLAGHWTLPGRRGRTKAGGSHRC